MKEDTNMFDELDGLDLSVLSKSKGITGDLPAEITVGEDIDSIEDLDKQASIDDEPKKTPAKSAKAKPSKDELEDELEDEEVIEDIDLGTDNDQRVSALKVFADMQREKGIIDFDDEEFEDSEEFLLSKVQDKITKGIESGIEDYKSSFTKEAQDLIEAIEAGVPLETLVDQNATINSYENIKDSDIDDNESLQRNLVRNLYSLKGYSKELIDKKIQRFEDSGLLAEEAKDAKTELLSYAKEQKETERKQKIKEQKDQLDKFEGWKKETKSYLDKTDEIIPGLKLTNRQKEVIFNGLTKFDKDGKNELQKMIDKDPNINLKVFYLGNVLNWDLSAFDKKAATKVAQGLKDALRDQDKLGGGYGGGNSYAKSNANLSVIEKALKASKQ